MKAEEKRVSRYLILISQNTNKRKESYGNRKLIKAGERESYRQRKIRLNKERRESLHKMYWCEKQKYRPIEVYPINITVAVYEARERYFKKCNFIEIIS